jgi:hypothetical protein
MPAQQSLWPIAAANASSAAESANQEKQKSYRSIVFPLQVTGNPSILEDKISNLRQKLRTFIFTMVVSVLVGFITWLSQIANISKPECKYYRTQVCTQVLPHTGVHTSLLYLLYLRCQALQ